MKRIFFILNDLSMIKGVAEKIAIGQQQMDDLSFTISSSIKSP